MEVNLTPSEIAELDKQKPSTASAGGYQGLLVSLQKRVDRKNGSLALSVADRRRIPQYAFNYGNGGWENRLKAAFGRSLGPELGRR